ncbi:MAG: hypothetical protein ACOX56_00865 [Acholeplasmataceae bacterium]|jgi:hypothetical protein
MKIEDVKNTIDLLKFAWQLSDNNIYEKNDGVSRYSKLDQLALKVEDGITLKISNFYPTHLWPHPWWGNIENPKVIVLALNPSYDPIDDEKDDIVLGGLYKKAFDDPVQNKINLFAFKSNSTDWWRNKVFAEEGKEVNPDKIIKNVGVFQILGYRSLSYFKIPKKALKTEEKLKKDDSFKEFIDKFQNICESLKLKNKYNDNYLPTQNAMRLHVQSLINEDKDRYVVIVWGKGHWKQLRLDFPDKENRVLRANEKNYRNQNIFKEQNKEYSKKIQNIIRQLIF